MDLLKHILYHDNILTLPKSGLSLKDKTEVILNCYYSAEEPQMKENLRKILDQAVSQFIQYMPEGEHVSSSDRKLVTTVCSEIPNPSKRLKKLLTRYNAIVVSNKD